MSNRICLRREEVADVAHKFFSGVIKAQNEGANAPGGALVPSQIVDAIINQMDVVGVGRQTCNVVPMASDVANVPRRLTGLSSAWTAEGVAIAESTMSWDSVGLTAKKPAALVRSSSEVAEDALVWADTIAAEMAYQLASLEDVALFNGDGTSTYGGIYGLVPKINDGTHTASAINAAAGHATLVSIDSADLASVYGALPSYAFARAAWFVHPVVFANVFCRLAGNTGGLGTRLINNQFMPTFWGLPVWLTAQMPSATSSLNNKVICLVGSMSDAVVLGSRREVTVKVSSGKLFDTDQLMWRATERVDINCANLGTNSVGGPLIALLGKT